MPSPYSVKAGAWVTKKLIGHEAAALLHAQDESVAPVGCVDLVGRRRWGWAWASVQEWSAVGWASGVGRSARPRSA